MLDTSSITKLFRSRSLSEREKNAVFDWNNASLVIGTENNENQPNSALAYFDSGTIEIIFNLSSMALIANICACDGTVNSKEFVAFTKAFRVPANNLNATAMLFRDACKENLGIEHYAKQTAKFSSSDPVIRIGLLKSLIKIADSDRITNAKEYDALLQIASCWKISSDVLKTQIRDYYCPEQIKPLEIMGLNKGFTFDELKTIYRKMSRELHPDKLNPSLYNDDLLDIYRERFSKITSAYRILTLQAKSSS